MLFDPMLFDPISMPNAQEPRTKHQEPITNNQEQIKYMKSKIMQSLKGNKKGDRLGVSLQGIDSCSHWVLQIPVSEYTYSSLRAIVKNRQGNGPQERVICSCGPLP